MKKYKEYMDSVKASDTLHQRLMELEAPARRPIPWKKYGSMAAVLALALCLGAFGLLESGAWARMTAQGQVEAEPEIESGPAGPRPDIGVADPGDITQSGGKTIGGYETTVGSGESSMSVYYVLPYIEYGEAGNSQASLDWDIPQGAFRKDITRNEIAALLGGADVLSTHLDWDSYELSGWAAWYEDGSFWGAYIQGYAGPLDHFEFAVTADQLPPTCIVFAESVKQEIYGVTLTADGYDSVAGPQGGADASSRRVSYMKDGFGYRFDITGTSRALTEERVSRLVRQTITNGVHRPDQDTASLAPPAGGGDGTYVCPSCGLTFPVGSFHNDPFIGADEPNHEDNISTPPYDPAGPGETHTCPICGEILSTEIEHAHKPCGYPLAPSPGTATKTTHD